MIQAQAMSRLVSHCVSQANRIVGRRGVKRIRRIEHHLAVIWEKIVGENVVIAINLMSANPDVGPHTEYPGVAEPML